MKQVFIAGAGPTGLTAALELQRRGFEPRIADPDLAPSPESRALGINPRTLDLLEPSGVTERLLVKGLKLRGAMFRYGTRPLMTIDIGLVKHRFNFMLSLAQSETEAILEAALREAGVAVERGVSLTGFSGNAMRLSNGASVEADVLIGADGAHSTVRKTLGFGFPGESEPQSFGLADVELGDWPFPFDRMVATLSEDYLCAFIPMREGFGRFVSSKPGTLARLPPDAKVRKCVWEADFNISYRQVESYQKDNVFLVGDAAHIHSPVGGRGMNLGIEDACWLAWLLEQGREAEFTALRHPVGASVLKVTAAPTGLLVSQSMTAKFIRRYAIPSLFSFAAVQRRVLPVLTALDTPPPPWL